MDNMVYGERGSVDVKYNYMIITFYVHQETKIHQIKYVYYTCVRKEVNKFETTWKEENGITH